MDRSVDSIGSCSLDVDADSSEFSDASFLTPLSTKDLTREFTSQIRDRCPMKPKVQNSIAVVDPIKGVCELKTISSQPTCVRTEFPVVTAGKKPSYLNLACCVNGYSSITTYDSKIRQDINKSREVSPIRPSTTGFQYCKRNNALAPPLPVAMSIQNNLTPSLDTNLCKDQSVIQQAKCIETNNNYNLNGHDEKKEIGSAVENSGDCKNSTSFIQQRVERLYGPGALAQGFYSPKKLKANSGGRCENAEKIEFNRKFKQLSPCRDYKEFNKKVLASSGSKLNPFPTIANDKLKNNAIDLPVLRHLSQEFRAQLPSISPKRSILRNLSAGSSEESPEHMHKNEIPNKSNLASSSTYTPSNLSTVKDELDHKDNNNADVDFSLIKAKDINTLVEKSSTVENLEKLFHKPTNKSIEKKKDGSDFLILLKNEQDRLLVLANRAEKYIDMLSNNPEVSEDILGILRSASGKARLLVTQKMKQFEGLCHNNLNRASEDKFPTTVEDLQGFWDMVNLQVDNINSTYEEIELLKKNNWKIVIEEVPEETKKPQIVIKKNNSKTKTVSVGSNNVSKVTSAISASTLRREAQRKQLMELKRKHKMAMTVSFSTPTADELQPNSLKRDEVFVNDNCS